MSSPRSKSTPAPAEAGGKRTNLLALDRAGLVAFCQSLGEKPFRATQLMKWIYQFGVDDFSAMTNLSKALRARLAEVAEVRPPEVVLDREDPDGTRKWLLRLADGNAIETVFIPEEGRGTLCVSSQVGCTLNCDFCATARQGYNRNLTVDEIIGQLWVANRALGNRPRESRVITNVVLMGMGEPLLNFDNVVRAVSLMLDDHAYGLSRRRVTLSTAGVVPALDRLHEATGGIALAVSLHAVTDELRDRLVPLNKKYPIAELLEACRRYTADGRSRTTFEYVMLDGVNDRPEDAHALVRLLQGVPAKVNLIPFNPFPGAPYRRSPQAAIDRFRDILLRAGITTITRKTRGQEIDAACGQLAGRVHDRTRRSQRLQQGRGAA